MLTEQEEEAVRALLAPDAVGERNALRALLAPTAQDERRRLSALLREESRIRALLAEARTIGAPSLIRRIFVQVYDAEHTVTAGSSSTVTFVDDLEAQDLVHAFYIADVHPTTTLVTVNHGHPHDGLGAYFNGLFYWTILKDQLASPARGRAHVLLVNGYMSDQTVQVKVYQIAGLS